MTRSLQPRKKISLRLSVAQRQPILGQLREIRSAYITIGEVEEMYRSVCEEYYEEPRAHTQIWEWVQDLNAHGIIDAKKSGIGQRGQTTLIGFSEVPAEMLELFLSSLLDSTKEATRKQNER